MARACPRCRFQLVVHNLEGVEIDHCHHCDGSFLDPGEESALFGPLLSSDVWQDSDMCTSQGVSRLLSPVSGKPMHAYRVFFRKPVEIDRCEQSGGLWLDGGEADRLRELVETASQADSSPLKAQRPKLGIFNYLLQLGTGLPLEVWNPRRRFPWAMLSLVLACVAIFGIELVYGMDPDNPVIRHFALDPGLFQGEQVWGLFSYMFLHGGFMHIIGNLFMLYILGDNIEDELGGGRFLGLYFLSGLAGGAAEVGLSGAGVQVVGASAAIAGVMAAYWVLFPRVRLRMLIVGIPVYMGVGVFFGLWVGFNLLMLSIGTPGVAWIGHLGGFVVGLCMALPYRRRPFAQIMRERVAKSRRP